MGEENVNPTAEPGCMRGANACMHVKMNTRKIFTRDINYYSLFCRLSERVHFRIKLFPHYHLSFNMMENPIYIFSLLICYCLSVRCQIFIDIHSRSRYFFFKELASEAQTVDLPPSSLATCSFLSFLIHSSTSRRLAFQQCFFCFYSRHRGGAISKKNAD